MACFKLLVKWISLKLYNHTRVRKALQDSKVMATDISKEVTEKSTKQSDFLNIIIKNHA
jgi:hypothetical protein